MKYPLVQYYLHQAGRGSHSEIGSSYSVTPLVKRSHGIGSFLSGLFRLVQPVLWRGVKAVGRGTLRTGGKILSDLPDNTSSNVKLRHFIAKHVSDSAQTLIQKQRGRVRKRATALKSRGLTPQKEGEDEGGQDYKKGHLFIGSINSYPTMAADVVSASTELDIFATSTIETIETA